MAAEARGGNVNPDEINLAQTVVIERQRRAMPPINPKPVIINAQLAGSGTLPTVRVAPGVPLPNPKMPMQPRQVWSLTAGTIAPPKSKVWRQ